ncbi:Polymer-forming cytoskeletal protein [Azospirillaceae bacterium]
MSLFGRKTPSAAIPKTMGSGLSSPGSAASGSTSSNVSTLKPVVLDAASPESSKAPLGLQRSSSSLAFRDSVSVVSSDVSASSNNVSETPAFPGALASHNRSSADLSRADKGADMTTSTKPPPALTPSSSSLGGFGSVASAQANSGTLVGGGRRSPDGSPLRPATPIGAPPGLLTGSATLGSDMRRLTVGRDITLAGEISSCDVLVVEGTVEARLREGKVIEISETGLFKGSVEINEATIAGRFEGDLIVRGRLTVRGSGRIRGVIKYRELEVEAGGQVVGDIQLIDSTDLSLTTATSAKI